ASASGSAPARGFRSAASGLRRRSPRRLPSCSVPMPPTSRARYCRSTAAGPPAEPPRWRLMLPYDLVIRNGRVLTDTIDAVADIAVTGERIAAIGGGFRGDHELDASGLYVLPGAIDGHVHMRTERPDFVYADTFATGSVAAAF